MISFTKYAEQKFDILNDHKVFLTREQVLEALKTPDKVSKKGTCLSARKDGVKVVYRKDGGNIRIVTFYPIKY
jgi:hypothetical protein